MISGAIVRLFDLGLESRVDLVDDVDGRELHPANLGDTLLKFEQVTNRNETLSGCDDCRGVQTRCRHD